MRTSLAAEEKLRSENRETWKGRLFDEKEKYQKLLMDKEQEISQIKGSRLNYEAEIRQQLDQRYRSDMEALRKEKDDASWKLKGEIEQLRSAMRTELMKMEQQVEEEAPYLETRTSRVRRTSTGASEKVPTKLTQLLAQSAPARNRTLLKLPRARRKPAFTGTSRSAVSDEQEKLTARIRTLEAESAAPHGTLLS